MHVEIKTYTPQDYDNLRVLIQSEGEEWEAYLKPSYQVNLEQSITYVAYAGEVLCGYCRSMNDHDLFVWVIDLLVHQAYRGHGLGKKLMDHLRQNFPNQDAYVMSDVDGYYEKLGYKKEGSIFKLS